MKPTRIQAKAIIVLWQSGLFDSFEISQATGIDEPSVCRILQAIRDIKRAQKVGTA